MAVRLLASVRLADRRVGEVVIPAGQPMTVGRRGDVVVPSAEEVVLSAGWSGDAVIARDAAGGEHRVALGQRLAIELGALHVTLEVVERTTVQRLAPLQWAASLPWFLVIVGATLLVAQGEAAWKLRCLLFQGDPVFYPLAIDCPVPEGQAGGAAAWNAEYLARLLRKDYAGDEEGVISVTEPVHIGKIVAEGYMPAGDHGPITEMGGAEQVAPVPSRKEKAERTLKPAPKKTDTVAPTTGEPVLPPVKKTFEGKSDADDGVSVDDKPEQPKEASEGRAEEKEGWGVRDWLDASIQRRDDAEVDMMVRYYKRKVQIRPDDIDALGLLAYYQYLQEDYTNAEQTFDKIIEKWPEDAGGFNNKALVYKRRKEYAKEEGLYRVALQLQPEDPTAMNNLAVNLAHQGRFDEAVKVMTKVEAALPGDAYTHLHWSKIHAAMGKDDQALSRLRMALESMSTLDLMHHIEFRQDLRLDPAFDALRTDPRFVGMLREFYGRDSPVGDP